MHAAPERLASARDVARLLGVPVSWVYENAKAGNIPSYKLGHYRRFRLSEFEQYLEARRQAPASEPGEPREAVGRRA